MRLARFISTTSCASALAIAVACSGGSYSSGPTDTGSNPGGTPSSASVTVSNDQFTPVDLTVRPGTTVSWAWNTCTGGDDIYGGTRTCVSHNVTFAQGPSSSTQSSGTFSRAFPEAGTFPYQCTIHGPSMSGRVIVQ